MRNNTLVVNGFQFKQTKKNKSGEGLHGAMKYTVFSSISLFDEPAHIKQQHRNKKDAGARVCVYVYM